MRNSRGPLRFLRNAGLAAVLFIPFVVVGCGWTPADHDAWRADLASLEDYLSATYANADDLIVAHGLKPSVLHDEALKAIDEGWSNRACRQALQHLINAFPDGHLRLESPPAWYATWFAEEAEPDVEAFAASFAEGSASRGLPFSEHVTTQDLPHAASAEFPLALATFANGRRLAILRIHSFGVEYHGRAAKEALARYHTLATGAPGSPEDLYWQCFMEAILARLALAVDAIHAAAPDALLMDLTGNGGGTDWVDGAARLFSERRLTSPAFQPIRHAHWLEPARHELAEIEALRDRLPEGDRLRIWLERVRARAAKRLEQIATPPDRRGLWRGEAVEPLLALGRICEPVWLAKLTTEEIAALAPIHGILGLGDPNEAPRAPWTGRLFLAMDGETASASEQFMAMLADGADAQIVGTRSYGAGAGYTRGGVVHVLPHSGLIVRAPDLARRRSDGSNEVLGLQPTLEAGILPADGSSTRAQKILAAIEKRLEGV